MPRIVVSQPNLPDQPYRVDLDRKSLEVGRAADADISIDEPSVSLKHCKIARIPGGYMVEDHGSTNGIKDNGTRHSRIHLVADKTITLSDEVNITLQFSDDEVALLASEPVQSLAETVNLSDGPKKTAPLPFPNTSSSASAPVPRPQAQASATPAAAPQLAAPASRAERRATANAQPATPEESIKKSNPVVSLFKFAVTCCFAAAALSAGYLTRYYQDEIAPQQSEASPGNEQGE